MNNKKIGMQFENEVCEILTKQGYWTHFITPDNTGAQPFDIIAVKNNVPFAIDCKTSAKHWFPLSRLEENQIMAFEKWLRCGNSMPQIFVKFESAVYVIAYSELKRYGKIDLKNFKKYIDIG